MDRNDDPFRFRVALTRHSCRCPVTMVVERQSGAGYPRPGVDDPATDLLVGVEGRNQRPACCIPSRLRSSPSRPRSRSSKSQAPAWAARNSARVNSVCGRSYWDSYRLRRAHPATPGPFENVIIGRRLGGLAAQPVTQGGASSDRPGPGELPSRAGLGYESGRHDEDLPCPKYLPARLPASV